MEDHRTPTEVIHSVISGWGSTSGARADEPQRILNALEQAGFAIVPIEDLAPLWHLHQASMGVGNMQVVTGNAARQAVLESSVKRS